jgi:hypothetical protein
VLFTKCYENEVDGVFTMHLRDEKCVQNLLENYKRSHSKCRLRLEDNILKLNLKKWGLT